MTEDWTSEDMEKLIGWLVAQAARDRGVLPSEALDQLVLRGCEPRLRQMMADMAAAMRERGG